MCCTSAPWRWDKTLAAVNIASLFFPPDALAGHGAEIAVKLGLKAGAHAGLGAVVVKLLEKVGLRVGGVDEAAIDEEIRSRAERKVEGVVPSCATCFVAGTLVATPHGERAIESLRVGDPVLAEDPTAGTVEAEAVQAVIQDPVSPLLMVELGDGSAITTTANHSFWVDEGASKPGWLEAGRLRVGDRLRTADGTEAVVTGLRRNVGQAVVYTLTIARDHTFFVGSARVLVHNCSIPSINIPEGQFGEKAGQHLRDFGRNPSNAADRQWLHDYILDIVRNHDEVRQGAWRGGAASDIFYFFRKGRDVVVTQVDGTFVTILEGGVDNGWFNSARVITTR